MFKISILTPSYNTGKYLQRAIDSVLIQNFKNWEHIIVDGGSTDNTLDILEINKHLTWISEPDKGQSDAMNKAFKMSSGDIIVYLNADDWFNENTFSKVIDIFNKNPKSEIIVSNLKRITYNSIEEKIIDEDIIIPNYEYKKVFHYYRYGHFPYNPISYFYKRSVQEKVGPFIIHNHYSMDLFFLLRAFQFSNVIKTNDVYGNYWNDGNNKTSTVDCSKNNYKTVIEHCRAFNKTGEIIFRWGYFYHQLFYPKIKGLKIFLYPFYKRLSHIQNKISAQELPKRKLE